MEKQNETPVCVTESDLGTRLKKGDLIECSNCGGQHETELAKNADGVETDTLMFVQCSGKSFCVGIAGRRWK